MNERIKLIRENAKLTQEAFGKKIGSARNTIANYENGNRTPSNAIILSICRQFSVNEEWLLTGKGDMYQLIEDEVATYVSQLLESKDNPVYELIIAIMKTYSKLDLNSQDVVKIFAGQLLENLKSRD